MGVPRGGKLNGDHLTINVYNMLELPMPDLSIVLKEVVKHAPDFTGAIMGRIGGLDCQRGVGMETLHEGLKKLVVDIAEVVVLNKSRELAVV